MIGMESPIDIDTILQSDNLLDEMSDVDRAALFATVLQDYEFDLETRREQNWEEVQRKSKELAKMEPGPKDVPFPGASNIRYPLIIEASLQFAARAYTNIIGDGEIVHGKVLGEDDENHTKEERARRIEEYQSYQMLEEMDGWLDDLTRLLVGIAVHGTFVKKLYWDYSRNIPVSYLIPPQDCVVDYFSKCFDSARRITHRFDMVSNDIVTRIRNGQYSDIEIHQGTGGWEEARPDPRLHKCIEQHTWWDMDGDGYEEPYVVTGLYDSRQPLRVIPRFEKDDIKRNNGQIAEIEPINNFVAYNFLPSIDGSVYYMGFGGFMYNNTEIINTIFNELIDAGRIQNAGGGLRTEDVQSLTGGAIQYKPGEWPAVRCDGPDIRAKLLPFHHLHPGPSPVLFNLLGFVVERYERFMAYTNVLSGGEPRAHETASAVLARIEQGLKLFGWIFDGLHRSIDKELKIIHRMNKKHLKHAKAFQKEGKKQFAITADDYKDPEVTVMPKSNPRAVSDLQEIAVAEALMNQRGTGFNDAEIRKRFLESLHVQHREKLLTIPPEQQGPDPALIIKQKELEIKQLHAEAQLQRVDVEKMRLLSTLPKIEAEIERIEAEIIEIQTKSIEHIASAEAKEAGTQLEQYRSVVDLLKSQRDLLKEYTDNVRTQQNQSQYIPGMAGGTDRAAVLQGTGGAERIPEGVAL